MTEQHLDRMDMLFQLIGGLPPADFGRGQPACDDPEASVAERRELAELFDPISERDTDRISAAKALCRVCPVRAACLEHAQRAGEVHGIWGGLTPAERRELRAERNAGGQTWHRVRVELGDDVFDDAVRAAGPQEALAAAEANWRSETPYEPARSITYLGNDEQDGPGEVAA